MTVIDLAMHRLPLVDRPKVDHRSADLGSANTKLVKMADEIGSIACNVCIHAPSLTPTEAAEVSRHIERHHKEMVALGALLKGMTKKGRTT